MKEKRTAKIILNPNGVVAPLLTLLKDCLGTVSFGLKLIENVPSIPKSLEPEETFFRVEIGKPEADLEVQKLKHKEWLLKKGFEDLVKGINLYLIEAYFFVSLLDKGDYITTLGKLNEEINDLRKSASEQSLPGLLSKVTPSLVAPLRYKNQIKSINSVRNCLVHRNGLVTQKDINDKKNKTLKLQWIRFKCFHEKNGEEVEVRRGEVIEGGTTIQMKQEETSITFKLGDKINFNYKQFNEFVLTCWLFGQDLVQKLPKKIK